MTLRLVKWIHHKTFQAGCSVQVRELEFGDKGVRSNKLLAAELLFLTNRFLARPKYHKVQK